MASAGEWDTREDIDGMNLADLRVRKQACFRFWMKSSAIVSIAGKRDA